jgi:hypothetical protein
MTNARTFVISIHCCPINPPLPPGEGTFCLYGGDADSCPVCGGGWYRLAIHYFKNNPVNVYGTAVISIISVVAIMFSLLALFAVKSFVGFSAFSASQR